MKNVIGIFEAPVRAEPVEACERPSQTLYLFRNFFTMQLWRSRQEGVLHAALKRELQKKKIAHSSFETLRSVSSALRTNGLSSCKLFVLFFLANCTPLSALFDHDIAVLRAQKEDWQAASGRLNKSLINYPNDPALLYDAGVAAEKQKDHQQAAEYFKSAAAIESDKLLKEHAYFDLGYCLTEIGQLQEAINAYEQALLIDPHDERARHNLEKVKEMLKKQQQQQQDNKQQKQDKNQKQDKQDKNNKDENDKQDQQNEKNEQNNDQQNAQSKNKDKNQSERDGNQEKGKGDKQLEKEERKETDKHGSDEEKAQRDADKTKGKDAENAAANHEPQQQQHEKNENDHRDHHGESPELEKKETPSANHHKQSPGQKQELQSVSAQEAENKNSVKKEEAPQLQPKLAALLEEQEQKDSRQAHRMMRALVNQQLAGHHGEQCW